jgi:hypothetical protein
MPLSEWRKHYDARRAAAVAVKTALKSGRLPRPTACCVCGKARERSGRAVSYHHHSYAPDDRLNVRPVCGSCHSRIHAGILPEPATGVLRPNRWGLTHPEMDAEAIRLLPQMVGAGHAAPGIAGRLFRALRLRAKRSGLLRGIPSRGSYITDAGRRALDAITPTHGAAL